MWSLLSCSSLDERLQGSDGEHARFLALFMSGFVFQRRLRRNSAPAGDGQGVVILLSDASDIEMEGEAADGSEHTGVTHVPQCLGENMGGTGPVNRHLELPVSVYADSDAVFRSCLMLQQYLLEPVPCPRGVQAEAHPAEAIALTCLQQGLAPWSSLMQIARLLPQARNPRFMDDASSRTGMSVLSFTTGASARGPNVSLTQNMRSFPGVSRLLALIVQAIDPMHRFSSCTLSLNTCARPHRDSHNSRQSCNLLIPCSVFEGGGVWLQNSNGSIRLDSDCPPGCVMDVSSPLRFRPHCLHATMPWTGDRLMLIGYHVRYTGLLPVESLDELADFGFNVDPGLD